VDVQEAATEILREAALAEALRVMGAAHPGVDQGGQERQEEVQLVREVWKALLGRRKARVDCAVAGATLVA